MSSKYRKEEVYVCKRCSSRHKTPGSAELCFKSDEIESLVEDVDNHKSLAMDEVIEHLKEIANSGGMDYEYTRSEE